MSLKFLTVARESRTRDEGSITLLVVVFFVALLAAVGLVVDGGTKLRAAREASAVAEEAARAGVGRIDRDRAYTQGGPFVVDRSAALAAARAYLASSGNTGSVSIVGAQTIRVTVTVSKPAILLSAIGIGDLQVTKTATADLLQGVERPTSGS
jgi:Flp pilus assembly protein TadG